MLEEKAQVRAEQEDMDPPPRRERELREKMPG
jgi:hypothetical protein